MMLVFETVQLNLLAAVFSWHGCYRSREEKSNHWHTGGHAWTKRALRPKFVSVWRF